MTTPQDTTAGLPPRLRRRRTLLAWSAPLVLVALLVGSVLLGMVLGNLIGTRHYEAGRFSAAAEQYDVERPWPPLVEAWRAPFNAGTAHYRAGENFLAVEELRTALELVPEAEPLPEAPADTRDPASDECLVRTNLSLAIEGMGDDATDVEDHEMAAAHYAEAYAVLDPCVAMQENQESSDRQKSKEESARRDGEDPTESPSEDPTQEPTESPSEEPTQDPTPDPTEDPSEDPTDGAEPTGEPTGEPTDDASESPSPDPQQEELEERNREAERDRQEQRQQRGGGVGGGQNW